MKVIQIANEYQALLNIFAEEGMMSFKSKDTATLKTRMVGRVTDKGDDWKLTVFHPGMNLCVLGNGKIYIEVYRGVTNTNKISLTKYIEGIRDPELKAEAEYKKSLIKLHARSIVREHTTPGIIAAKVSATKAKFAQYVKEAKDKLTVTNTDPMV